jgi:threonine dehydrogenase-like Zn-dependent dehydrogenase
MAKHLGADKVLVLDNNPAKVALIDSLGEGFRGVCTDWLKEGRGSVDDARLAAMHEGIRLECRSNGLHGKGADMLINCVADPSAVFRHVGVLDGTRSPMIVQAGGSREPIAWSTALNRSFMTAEATYTHAYRYAPEDFDAALECLYSHPELAARLIGSITPSGVQGNSGARGAFERARSDSGRSGKSLIGYSGEHDEDQIFEHSKGELVASPG